MLKNYSMKEAVNVGDVAVSMVVQYLSNKSRTVKLVNVEAEKEYQQRGIDLLWHTRNGKGLYGVEVKGDRYFHTGNFFFETISNDLKQTPGCFMYSEADIFAYCFVEPRVLYLLPMKKVREWFSQNERYFETRATSTSQNGKIYYRTIGKLVPRHMVEQDLGVKKLELVEVV